MATTPPKEIYGKFPAWIVRNGVLPMLTQTHLRLFSALVVLAHNETHVCMPTIGRIAQVTGIPKSSISAAAKFLAEHGLIRKWRYGNRMRYAVLFVPPEWAVETKDWLTDMGIDPERSERYPRDEGPAGTLREPRNILFRKHRQLMVRTVRTLLKVFQY